jgi:hypothetical protein
MKIEILRMLDGHWPPHCANGMLERKHGFEITMDERMFFWVKDTKRGTVRCYPVHSTDSWDPVPEDGETIEDLVRPVKSPASIKRGPGRPPKSPLGDGTDRVA